MKKKEKKYILQQIVANKKVIAEQVLEITFDDKTSKTAIAAYLLRIEEKFLQKNVKVKTKEISLYEVYKKGNLGKGSLTVRQ